MLDSRPLTLRPAKGITASGFALLLAACTTSDSDGPMPGSGTADTIAPIATSMVGPVWLVASIDGNEFDASARLVFKADGKISGSAPCNGFNGRYQGQLGEDGTGAVSLDGIAATRMTCPEQDAENELIDMLLRTQKAELVNGNLYLSGHGHKMKLVAS